MAKDFKEHKEFGRRKKKVCIMCTGKDVNYKDVDTLKRFINDRVKIVIRRITVTCALHQRHISINIKIARAIGLLPFTK